MASAAESVVPRDEGSTSIARELEVLVDPTATATLAEIMGPLSDAFRPVDTDRPTTGVSDSATWTRVKIDLSEDPARATRRAQFSALHPDAASFYIVDDEGRILRTYHGGLAVLNSATYRKFSVAIGDLPASRFTLYARMTSFHNSILIQNLLTAEEETRTEFAAQRILGPMFGAMALGMLFCFLLWCYLREKVYGYGFAFIAAFFIGTQAYVNQDRLYWPEMLQERDAVHAIYIGAANLISIFGLQFSSHFLGIPSRRPGLHTIVWITAVLMTAATVWVIAVSLYDFAIVSPMVVGAATLLIGVMFIDAVRTRQRIALIYFVIAAPVVACLVLANAASNYLIAQHPVWTSLVVISGTLLAAGITLALADGFRQSLETKVRERTAELLVANEALQEAHEAKNRMLGVVAHDLRNPLSGIRAAAQLILEIPLERSKRETLLRTIRDGADVTLSMTEDLLDVAAIREGKVELNPDAIDLAAIVESRAELLRMTAQTKDIELRLDLARLPPVWADAKRAAQVLDNLVGNAVKFSPFNTTVTIELRALNGRACLAVVDEAGGIPVAELTTIFEPFERASTRPTGGERSAGLGLAIVKRLVEAQGGEIKVDSVVGRGSRFAMYLPFATTILPAMTPASARSPVQTQSTGTRLGASSPT